MRIGILAQSTPGRNCPFQLPLSASPDEAYEIFLVDRVARGVGSGTLHKRGLEQAKREGWDCLVLLADEVHGSGTLATLLTPITNGTADGVIGSALRTNTSSRRTLDGAYNVLAGSALTNLHSPFRAYRVAALGQLDLANASDRDDFDSQLVLRMQSAGHHLVEVSIDEHPRCPPLQHGTAIRDISHALRAALGRVGLGRGALGRPSEIYQFKPAEHSSHSEILRIVPSIRPLRILDVGCGAGFLSENLRRRGHTVIGIDIFDGPDVRTRVDEFYVCDLDHGLVDDVGEDFDVIVAADVVEHVREPDLLLASLRSRLAPDGFLIVSVPNFGHWYPRTRTALGRFDYDQRGILDRGHVRLFTLRSFRRLAAQTGFDVTSETSTGLPLDALHIPADRTFGRMLARIDGVLTILRKTLFSYQFVFTMVRSVAPPAEPMGDRDP